MSYIIIVTIAVVIFSLIFDFINGFHDTANAVATAVSTRALTPKTAILMAAVMNFIGALTFTGVAGTITKDIVDPFKLENGLVVVLAAILAAIIWNLATWFYGIPSSSSHALIGSIAGAAIASEGSFECYITKVSQNYYCINRFTDNRILCWFLDVFNFKVIFKMQI